MRQAPQSTASLPARNLARAAIHAPLEVPCRDADIEGKITVDAQENAKCVTLTLKDNGPGIPEDIRENLFEPFITRGKNEGTGLGTAIVKSIIEAHRGEIEFETSALGTTFTIRLPK